MSGAVVAQRVASPPAGSGSTVQLEGSPRINTLVGTLRLRGEPSQRRRIRWADDVIDNEGMGKKSSKVCCIYHKPRAVGESSSDEDSDYSSSSNSDSESEPDNSTARPSKGKNHNHHSHDSDESCKPDHSSSSSKRASAKKLKGKRSPNAYEKMPKGSSTTTQVMK